MSRRLVLAALLAGSALAATLPSRAVLSGECCPGAVWTPDSRALLFLDGPPARGSTGIYQVSASGGAVTRRFSSVAFFSPALRWAVRPGTGDATTLERLADGRKFTLPTRGSDVTWNRAETRAAYTRSDTSGNYDRRASRVFVADVFGAPRQVATLYGGGVSAWLNDTTLLLTGKPTPQARDRELFTLDIRSGARRVLRQALGVRALTVSPDGRFVAYTIAFDSAARNGLWVQATAGGTPRELNDYGSYRWRDSRRLLLIPLKTSGGPHTLRQYDVTANAWTTLGDLGDQVRQSDWGISPDGKRLNYLSAKDGNVRVLTLP
ncbi:TolB family protein [Deinococcus arboris]|uniref:TolB family protein n=1 Tax=Deinococcus arboris TaxID=2682977 RepID=UPI0034E290AF